MMLKKGALYLPPTSTKRKSTSIYCTDVFVGETTKAKLKRISAKSKRTYSDCIHSRDSDLVIEHIEFNISHPIIETEKKQIPLQICDIFTLIFSLAMLINTLVKYILQLEEQIKLLKEENPFYKQLLNEGNCKLYTNIDKLELFHKIHG